MMMLRRSLPLVLLLVAACSDRSDPAPVSVPLDKIRAAAAASTDDMAAFLA